MDKVGDCCAYILTETWLNLNTLAQDIAIDRQTVVFQANRTQDSVKTWDGALCVQISDAGC